MLIILMVNIIMNNLLEDAVEYINKALIIDPESPKGLTVKTMIEFHKKNWETMFVSAEKAFSLNAGDPSVLSNLATKCCVWRRMHFK